MKPFDFKMTLMYFDETNILTDVFSSIDLENGEIPICSTKIDLKQWTLLTTRRIITRNKEDQYAQEIKDFKAKNSGNFKGYRDIAFEQGTIELYNGKKIPYFLETGKPSMVMIYGIQTAMQIIPRGNEWIEKTEKRYKNRGLID